MSVLSKEELMNSIKQAIGEDKSDNSIKLIEDVTDTFDKLENEAKDTTDWKKKFEDNDNEWREKYKERFFNGSSSKDDEEEKMPYGDDTPKKLTYENLFKED